MAKWISGAEALSVYDTLGPERAARYLAALGAWAKRGAVISGYFARVSASINRPITPEDKALVRAALSEWFLEQPDPADY